jgi:hypothetical protein
VLSLGRQNFLHIQRSSRNPTQRESIMTQPSEQKTVPPRRSPNTRTERMSLAAYLAAGVGLAGIASTADAAIVNIDITDTRGDGNTTTDDNISGINGGLSRGGASAAQAHLSLPYAPTALSLCRETSRQQTRSTAQPLGVRMSTILFFSTAVTATRQLRPTLRREAISASGLLATTSTTAGWK